MDKLVQSQDIDNAGILLGAVFPAGAYLGMAHELILFVVGRARSRQGVTEAVAERVQGFQRIGDADLITQEIAPKCRKVVGDFGGAFGGVWRRRRGCSSPCCGRA